MKKIRKDIQKKFSPKKSVGNTRHNNFFRGSQVPSAPIHSLLLIVDIRWNVLVSLVNQYEKVISLLYAGV